MRWNESLIGLNAAGSPPLPGFSCKVYQTINLGPDLSKRNCQKAKPGGCRAEVISTTFSLSGGSSRGFSDKGYATMVRAARKKRKRSASEKALIGFHQV